MKWYNVIMDVDSFYSSKAWRKCRASFIAMRGGLCERCAAVGIISPIDDVHHKQRIKPSTLDDPNVTLNFDNLEGLCKECHKKEHGKQGQRADENGHVEL